MPSHWTDDPITTNTRIRTIHINEMRRAVDNYRVAVGISPGGWTDNPVTTSTRVRATHFTELRTAVQQLWDVHHQGNLPNWSMGTPPSPSRQISRGDVNDLRSWIDQTDPPPPTIGVNIDPGFPVASPTIQRVTTAHFGGLRFTLKNLPEYTSYITTALDAGLNIVAVVATNDFSWAPVDTRVVLQIYNEPDVHEADDPSHYKTAAQYAQMWANWRGNPQYQGYLMYTAGFGTGQPQYYWDFIQELLTNYPNVGYPAAVAIHMYNKPPSEVAGFINNFTAGPTGDGINEQIREVTQSIPPIVTEWNPVGDNQEHAEWIIDSQSALSQPGTTEGAATLWSSWFPWSTAQRTDHSVPGLYDEVGQKRVQCDRLVHDALSGQCT